MEKEFSLDEINQIAQEIINLKLSKVVLFHGEMGSGKTTLIKAIAKQLGITSMTNSPTFSIVNEYTTFNNLQLYHFDLYRIKNENEALDFGIEEYLYSGNWCFIEWPNKIPNLLPENYSEIYIETTGNNNRKIKISI